MADRVLRDHSPGSLCEHGYHLNHWVGLAQWQPVDEPNAEWCPGGREVAIDREGARATAADVLHCDVSTPEIDLILDAALGEA